MFIFVKSIMEDFFVHSCQKVKSDTETRTGLKSDTRNTVCDIFVVAPIARMLA